MKKVLSVLLAAMAIVGLAIPMASALNIVGTLTPASATIYTDPDPADPTQSSYVDVILPAAFHSGCSATCLVYWDVTTTLGDNIVTFRPDRYLLTPGTPIDINNTYGEEFMRLGAYAEGTVTVYAECQECGDAWTIEITVIAPDPEDPPKPQGLFAILSSWWFDLKWTWDFQIHPFFKYIYFNICDWIVNAWNLFINWVASLFN